MTDKRHNVDFIITTNDEVAYSNIYNWAIIAKL